MYFLSYAHYAVLLLVVTGILLLYIDVPAFDRQQWMKEKKVTQYLGWINVALGTLIFVANWVYETWIL